MSDNYLQTAEASGTTTAVATLNGVTAGSAIVAFLWDGSNAAGPTTHTVDDGTAYTSRGPSALDNVNAVWVQGFSLANVSSGTHTITGTIDTGDACFLKVVEIGASGASSFSGANSQFQNNPGTGADAVSSGTATVTAAATLIAMSTDSSSVNPSDEPNAGTAFTTRDNNANGTIGAWRLESKAVSADAAGTFTAPTGTNRFVTAAVAILNPAGGDVLMSQVCL